MVYPTDTSVPSQLICAYDCPTVSTLGDKSKVFTDNTKDAHGGIAKANAVEYDFDASAFTLKAHGQGLTQCPHSPLHAAHSSHRAACALCAAGARWLCHGDQR